MALLRQSGADRLPGRGPHELPCGGDEQAGGRASQRQGGGRARRPGHRGYRRVSLLAITVTVAVGLLVSVAVFQLLIREHEVQGRFEDERWQDKETKRALLKEPRWRLERSLAFKKLRFGKGSLVVDGDSRYWDRDDRRRDENYEETSLELSNVGGRGGSDVDGNKRGRRNAGHLPSGNGNGWRHDQKKSRRAFRNEVGRAELKDYDDKFEESLKQLVQSQRQGIQDEEADDEYDHRFHMEDTGLGSSDESEHDDGGLVHQVKNLDTGSDGGFGRAVSSMEDTKDKPEGKIKSPNFVSTDPGMRIGNGNIANELVKSSISGRKKAGESGNRRHRRFSGRRGCEMKFLNSSSLLMEPLEKKKFSRFSLRYKEAEERPDGVENWEPRFAGHQTLQEREESFIARDQNINCGFVKYPNRSKSTGFDIAEDDIKFMSSCHIAVSSCIFGNSDRLRTPNNKMIKRLSRKAVCFVMFVDEVTLQKLSTEGQEPDGMGFVGLWRIIVVKNLPYTDMRRAGKIPKFLAHRLFPSARYSIWLDSKLRLTSDPLFLLEYFLWRKGNEYAISNHYDRHCVWEEVMQNKRLNKFNHTLIDEQFTFYQSDGLPKFNTSDPDKLLRSYVPEGSFILRAHTSMSNLFSCLWFNEVDRFTPRDQLSFAYTFLKLRRTNPDKPFYLNMFKDCERRALAKLYRHRSADKWNQVQSTE